MRKLLSIAELPILVLTGILGQKAAAKLWSAVAGSDPPDTAREDFPWRLLLPVAIVEGTLYKLSRMLVERALRLAVARATGGWVGRAGEGE